MGRSITTNSFLWFVVDEDGELIGYECQEEFTEKEARNILRAMPHDVVEKTGLKVKAFSLKPEVG